MPRKNNIKKVALYVRVSTDRQTVDMQTRELKQYVKNKGWAFYKIFKDEGFSGKNVARPAFSEMMIQAHQKKFNVLLVWKLDRLSRSVKELVTTLDNLSNMGIDFVSCSDGGMGTSTPTGKLTSNVTVTIAEFERDIIYEWTSVGGENAKAKGKRKCL